MKERQIRYKYLLNCLALFAADFQYLMSIDSPTFDIEFELPSELEIGLDIENIDYLQNHKLITADIKNQLIEYRELIISVPDAFWTIEELETNPIWNKVREEGNRILDNLGIPKEKRIYDFSMDTILYYDKNNDELKSEE